jgi:hypothetical protein
MTAMFKTVSSAGAGWSNYVFRDRPENDVSLLYGDLDLGDAIVDNGKWKSSQTNIVLSFDAGEGQRLGEEKIKKIVAKFVSKLMHGHKRDEFHFDAVLHKDTNTWHVHIRIPKMNLKTNTALDIYLHKRDKKRLDLITNYLEVRHNLVRKDSRRKLVPDFDKAKHINKVRAENNQPSFSFAKKKERDASKNAINREILSLVKNQNINSFDDLKKVIKSDFGLEIVKQDFDQTKQQHYLTIANDTGKVRVFGEIYSKEFYDDSRTDRKKQVENNIRFREIEPRSQKLFDRISAELEIENGKRAKYLDSRFGHAREKAEKRRSDYSRSPDHHHRSADSKPIPRPTLTTTNHKNERVKDDRDTETFKRRNEALKGDLVRAKRINSLIAERIKNIEKREQVTRKRCDRIVRTSHDLRKRFKDFGKRFREGIADVKQRILFRREDAERRFKKGLRREVRQSRSGRGIGR